MLEQAAPQDIVDRGKTTVIEVDADRCDARDCGAKAYVYAQLNAGPISFCSHHGTEYWDGLNAQALLVIDLRDTVLAVTT